jgi:hypothetical protein
MRDSFYSAHVTASYNNFFGLAYAETDRSIVNKLRLSATAKEAATAASTLAWLEADTFSVNAGASTDFWINYVNPNDLIESVPAINVTTPVPTTDYLFYTGLGGTGSNYTATSSVDFTGFASSAKLTVHNHGASAMYVNRLQVRGTPILSLPRQSVVTENASSQAYYGLHEATEEHTLFTSDVSITQLSLQKLNRKKEPTPEIEFALKNIFPNVFSHELQDQVWLRETNTGLNNAYYLMGMSHDINTQNGLEHVVRYTVEGEQ